VATGGGEVFTYDPRSAEYSPEFPSPHHNREWLIGLGIAVGPEGDLFFGVSLPDGESAVTRISPAGELEAFQRTTPGLLAGIDVRADGAIVVAGRGLVFVTERDFARSHTFLAPDPADPSAEVNVAFAE
jgi:hypothetical protein